jgi:O-acetylserine/cysteine efflux transporter
VSPRDTALGLALAGLWGLAFVVTRLALESFSPLGLTVLRFGAASLAAPFLARPPLAWERLVALGLTLYAGQFVLQFAGIAAGAPAGVGPASAILARARRQAGARNPEDS